MMQMKTWAISATIAVAACLVIGLLAYQIMSQIDSQKPHTAPNGQEAEHAMVDHAPVK